MSISGLECQTWDLDEPLLRLLSYSEKTALRGHNYCREVPLANQKEEVSGPWCFVAPGWPEECDVPQCESVGEARSGAFNVQCKTNERRCESGGCISTDWICDGDKDCPGGEDEKG